MLVVFETLRSRLKNTQTLLHIPLLLTSDRIYLTNLQAIKEVFNWPETVKHSFSVTLNFLVMQISTLLTQSTPTIKTT